MIRHDQADQSHAVLTNDNGMATMMNNLLDSLCLKLNDINTEKEVSHCLYWMSLCLSFLFWSRVTLLS